MTRRWVAAIAAVVLVCQAIVIVLLQTFMGMVVDEQQMSLAGLDPRMMSVGTIIGGALMGLYLLGCAGILAVTAIRDRAPGRTPRLLLISAAVLHAVLGALTVGLVGWPAFAFMMLVVAVLVGTLVAYARVPKHRRTGGDAPPEQMPPAASAEPTAG